MTICKSARLVGYVPLVDGIGFALPIFRTEAVEADLIQDVDEVDSRVRAFKQLDEVRHLCHFETPNRTLRLGEGQCHVFAGGNGDVWCGELWEISESLRDFAEIYADNPGLRLQIFDLVGTRDERKKARRELEESIAKSLGPTARLLFRNTALRSELWRLLVESAPSRTQARNILNKRGKLSACLQDDGVIALDLSCLDEIEASWVNRERLTAELGSSFEP